MNCRHCGMEIERCPDGDAEIEEATALQDYTNTVTETWRETGTNFWLICPRDGSYIGMEPPFVWHEPFSLEEMLISLRSIEADLR